MHHAYIDHLSTLDSPVHRLDPRAKLACALLYCAAVASLPVSRPLLPAWCVPPLAAAVAASRLPLRYLARRCLMLCAFAASVALFFPFTLARGDVAAAIGPLKVYTGGLAAAGSILFRFALTTLAVLVLACTTPFPRLLRAMQWFGLPRLFIMVLAFLYRYLFVLVDEADRIARARDSRCPSRRGRWAAAPAILGMLFVRSVDRSDRIYAAMLSRGFDGAVRVLDGLAFRRADAAVLAGLAIYLSLFLAAFLGGWCPG